MQLGVIRKQWEWHQVFFFCWRKSFAILSINVGGNKSMNKIWALVINYFCYLLGLFSILWTFKIALKTYFKYWRLSKLQKSFNLSWNVQKSTMQISSEISVKSSRAPLKSLWQGKKTWMGWGKTFLTSHLTCSHSRSF